MQTLKQYLDEREEEFEKESPIEDKRSDWSSNELSYYGQLQKLRDIHHNSLTGLVDLIKAWAEENVHNGRIYIGKPVPDTELILASDLLTFLETITK